MAKLELPLLWIERISATVAPSRLVLINRTPEPDERAVLRDSTLALSLVDVGADGIDRSATLVWVGGELAFDGLESPEIAAAFRGPSAQIVQSADTLQICLDPLMPFESEAHIEVRVRSATLGGAHSLDESYAFWIEDRTAPRLLAGRISALQEITLSFDEAVQIFDAQGFVLVPLDRPAMIPQIASAQAQGDRVLLRLKEALSPGVRYEITVSGVADLSGNPILAPSHRAVLLGFHPPRLGPRRFDLWSMLPRYNRREDVTGDLQRFIACLQEVTDLLLLDVDRFPEIFDFERAPERFLDLILADLGNPFPFDLDELGKRRLASVLVEMYQQKGTAQGIINAVRFFLGVEIEAVTAYAGEALVLGESELGVDWVLGPSNRFARYAFDVQVGVVLTASQRAQLRAIVEYLKPAHTHFVQLIEPAPPEQIDHWCLGLSELGVESDLH